MSDEVQTLYEQTLKLINDMDQTGINDLLELVEFREHVINTLFTRTEVITEEEKRLIAEINKFDEIINSRMLAIKDEVALALHNINKASVQKKTYEQNFSADSYFIDKRE